MFILVSSFSCVFSAQAHTYSLPFSLSLTQSSTAQWVMTFTSSLSFLFSVHLSHSHPCKTVGAVFVWLLEFFLSFFLFLRNTLVSVDLEVCSCLKGTKTDVATSAAQTLQLLEKRYRADHSDTLNGELISLSTLCSPSVICTAWLQPIITSPPLKKKHIFFHQFTVPSFLLRYLIQKIQFLSKY